MKITNKLNLPQPLVDAVANDGYTQGEASISVTELLSPPRLAALRRQYEADLEEDASDRIYALLGQAVATVLERANLAPAIAEHRLYMEIDGQRVSGQFDRMAVVQSGEGWTISDYKVCAVREIVKGLKAEREQQLNCYAALARANGFDVAGLEIVAILRDWSKMKALREPAFSNYPRQQVQVVPVALWDDATARRFMSERLALHLAARAGALPRCTPKERWEKPAKFAVMKPGRKSALRLFDTEAEATIFSVKNPGTHVEKRPGEAARCVAYCPVANYCDQYQTEVRDADAA